VDRARQVFVNRNLRLSKIEFVGFDMDYTLALYHSGRMEQLSFEMTLERMVSKRGYPEALRALSYEHPFAMRGLVVDRLHGNLIKMDRFGFVGRAFHGRRALNTEERHALYLQDPIRMRDARFASIDTLFALPEACLFSGVIEVLEATGERVDYGKLYDDVRGLIDEVHRDGSLKSHIQNRVGDFIHKDPELGPALHKLRSSGKKLFLLTNSLYEYTQAVMGFLLDGVVSEYPTWRHYFDFVLTGAQKPAFFGEGTPFRIVDTASSSPGEEAKSLERWKVYQGGNIAAFERMSGFSGDDVLYVGDHIYGDILKTKKTSLWRTCMVVQELEQEISYTDGRAEEIARLSEVERTRAWLDDEVNQHKAHLNAVERHIEREETSASERANLDEDRRRLKAELERLRRALREANELSRDLEADLEQGFNRFWGLLFKEGNENSRFGEQVEKYACLYTSRVSNLLQYSPMQYFRSSRALMAHERAGALSGKLSPGGSETPPRGGHESL
jgi:HAD superfamily 5'-nucleotidase-like hydrolase